MKKVSWLKIIVALSVVVLVIISFYLVVYIRKYNTPHLVKVDSNIVCSIQNKVPIADLVGISLDISEIDEGIVGEAEFDIETISDNQNAFKYEIYLIEENNDARISGNYIKVCLFDEDGNILNEVNKNEIPTFSNLKVSSSYAYARRVYLGAASGNVVKKFRLRIWLADNYFAGSDLKSFSVRVGARVVK